ncbi:inositol monophosphatase family protein [Caldisphaera sp.]|uniref:inositol monophosphatase family protein n=1 Tax=Caldisphaera sp. TaxID=2060322 RepID=UPI0025C09291|nr:inositol monophosphatase family protein [Caldisphaera sp.]
MYDGEELRKIMIDVTYQSVKYLRKNFCNKDEIKLIKGETIKADLESEKIIAEALSSYSIDYKIVTEESNVIGNGKYTFVLDPLDGSINYENCIPWSSVSLAVIPPNKKKVSNSIAGVVYPVYFNGEPFSFSKGNGCFEGNNKIEINKEESKILFAYLEKEEEAFKLAKFITKRPGLKIRSLGSSALELIYTGLGRSYAFIDLRGKLRNVDVAAAIGFIRECNGFVVNSKGEDSDVDANNVNVIGDVIATLSRKTLDFIIDSING